MIRGFGLKPLPEDKRDFNLGAVFPKPTNLGELAGKDFRIGEPLAIKDQAELDFCTAFATTSASEFQENVLLNPYWQFAKIKELEGSYESWGANLRVACKSLQKPGSILMSDAAWSDLTARDRMANWRNWETPLDAVAKKHKKQSYFAVKVDNYPDLFDSLRARLWEHRAEKRAIVTGAMWRQSWTLAPKGLIEDKDYSGDTNGFGHAFIFVGQQYFNGVPTLVAQLSNGRGIGDNGYFYFPRGVINKEFTYGNFMFIDMPKEVAAYLSENELTASYSLWAKFVLFIKKYVG